MAVVPASPLRLPDTDETRRIRTGGVALMVGMGGRLAALALGAILDAGLRCVIAANVDDTRAHLGRTAPRVILAPVTLPPYDLAALEDIAREARARLVVLPAIIGPGDVAHYLQVAIASSSMRPDESGLRPAIRVNGDDPPDEEPPPTWRAQPEAEGVAPVSRKSR